ncbi:uncharacterized protein PG986_012760 [Apiospora aurea]|uniref:EngB-type G domain-containing protein n=1 Tax=Apiospora aurea TaxID=335848 RepID=A0ABR1Q0X9_9PEZI
MAPRQLRALLAMPPALRPLLLTSPNSTALWPTNRGFEIIWRSYASRRPLAVGAFVIPPTPNLPLTEVPVEQLLESPTPDKTLHADLNALFTRNPATFYHGTSDFYSLKKNTQVPEICILGRSNVGKSTFVNALANRRGNELAHTSAKAGKTRAMNAYGFGPPPPPVQLLAADTDVKRTEDMPKHSLFIVDMPGYGHKSLKEWGKNITLYLNKRQSIKGAVVLIDGEVGPKQGDLMALKMLSEAGLKTMIVLTKADKVKHEEMLKKTCQTLWAFMRDTAATDPESDWQWDRDFFVTAVGATKKEVGIASVDIARLAVARLAGLIEEKARPEPEYPKSWSGKVVSFDDLEIRPAPTTRSPPTPGVSEAVTAPKSDLDDSSTWTDLERAARERYLSQVSHSIPSKPRDPEPQGDSGWASLEQAAWTQKETRDSLRAPLVSESRAPPRPTASAFARPSRRMTPSSISRPSRRAAPSSNRRTQSRGLHTTAGLKRPPRESKEVKDVRREVVEAELAARDDPVQDEESKRLHSLAHQYIIELRARSLPNVKTRLKSSKHDPSKEKKLANAGSSAPPKKRNAIFNPLVSRKKFTPEHKKKVREKAKAMKKRALEIADDRVEKEERRKLVQAEQERRAAEQEAMGLARPSHSRGGAAARDRDEDAEERLDSRSFAESFEQIDTAQRQLKGKKAKAEAKKQKKAERMTKDRPKEEEVEEDPFLAKFANVK